MFANGTTIYIHDPSVNKAVETLSFEFKKVYGWLATNKLSLNVIKTNLMVFASAKRAPPDHTITINDTIIHNVHSIKFLGVRIDDQLSWKDHICGITKKII